MKKITPDTALITITHPDKMLFPDDGITKRDLVEYYAHIAPFILPFLKNRPLTMERFPDGIYGDSFFQKDASPFFPEWIQRENIPKKEGGITHYVVCQNTQTLLYLANLAVITIHLWLSNIQHVQTPDKLIFDLDPPSLAEFPLVVKSALTLKLILEELGLQPFVMTTGSKGLHVVVPIKPKLSYKEVQLFARGCALLLIQTDPEGLTSEFNKAKRGKKVFIDIYRNEFGATAVSPYSVRPKPKAPVATPLMWQELEDPSLISQMYTIETIFKRIEKIPQPWADFDKQQSLTKPLEKLLATIGLAK